MSLQTHRQAEIVRAALALLESQGPDAVTMRAVGQQLGMRAPSLYKHIADKGELEAAVIAEGLRDSGEHLAAAIENSEDPLVDLAAAYRTWALRRPHLYRLMTHKALPRELLPEGVEAAAAAPVLAAVGGDQDLARAAWALAHGLTSLEIAGRFPPDADVDAAWRRGVDALNAQARTRRRRPAKKKEMP